jgi:transposase
VTIDINTAVKDIEKLLEEEKGISPAMSAAIKMLLLVIKLMGDRLGLNSSNSSKPPSSDQNRKKVTSTDNKDDKKKKAGGQQGHAGTTLTPEENPDKVDELIIDKRTLPSANYQEVGFETRQVVDIKISRFVTEYRAQILENEAGDRFVAEFPKGVTRPIQYGASVKANAVYMSMFQLIPYERIQTHFAELFEIPISAGTLYNFNRDAYQRLNQFDLLVKHQLTHDSLMHVDETGINIGGTRMWLHGASNLQWTYFYPHQKRGSEAMDEMGVLPNFNGTLCHDHWKPYYKYSCLHSLCNAHHLRELTRAFEQDDQKWAQAMHLFLTKLNESVKKSGGKLEDDEAQQRRQEYRNILNGADTECPEPVRDKESPKRGRLKRSKSRNLLERLRNYEEDVLRFIKNVEVPFTNNQGERDIRMTKVQQKISGCFRSMDGAQTFCLIRSYLSTCRKNGVGVGEALECLFGGSWPEFIQTKIDLVAKSAE